MTPENQPQSTEKKLIPHSGDLGLEKPVREYKETELEAFHNETGFKTPDGSTEIDGLVENAVQEAVQEVNIKKDPLDGWNPEQYAKPKKKKMSRKAAFIAIGTVIATGATLTTALVLGSGGQNNNNPNVGKKPVAASSATPVESTPSQGTVETDPSKAEVLKQTTPIEAMQTMSYQDFAKLSYADRVAFRISKTPASVEVSATTAEDKANLADPASIPGFYWQQEIGVAYGEASQQDGVKDYLGIEYYTVKDNGEITDPVQAELNGVLANGGKGVGVSTSYKFESAGKLQSGKDRFGNIIQWINITVTPQDDNTQKLGETVTIQAIRTPVALLNGETAIVYGMGYVVSGKASPVEGFSY